MLPPAQGALSLEQLELRREVRATAKFAFAAGAAPGTVRTHKATLLASAPKVTARLGSQELPMSWEDASYGFCSGAVLPGPKTAASVSVHPAVRWRYSKLVKAAADFWRVARGSRAVLGGEWSPRMGAFCSGIKRSCVHVSMEKAPLLLPDARAVCARGESSLARRREATRSADLPPTGSGLGSLLEDSRVQRPAVSRSAAFLGARRASEVAALRVSYACVSKALGDVEIGVRCQKNDQSGVGQMAHMVALPLWKVACPGRLLSGRLCLREWPAVCRDR